jgi:hypothetical protein
MVLVVLRILNTCVVDFCIMCGVISLEFVAVFVDFSVWIGPGFIFESFG